MIKINDAESLTAYEEGYRAKPYYCTEKYPTIGIGLRIGPKNAPLEMYEMEFSLGEAKAMLRSRIAQIEIGLDLDQYCMKNVRRAVIISLAYQVGVKGCKNFKKMWKHIKNKNWDGAADEYLDSRAAKQTPLRFARGAEAIRSGSYSVYN